MSPYERLELGIRGLLRRSYSYLFQELKRLSFRRISCGSKIMKDRIMDTPAPTSTKLLLILTGGGSGKALESSAF